MTEGSHLRAAVGPKLKQAQGENIPEQREKLRSAISTYQIPDTAFQHSPEQTIEAALRLLEEYKVDSAFFDDPERNVFALAIADAWLSTDRRAEKKSLLNILKLVSVNEISAGDSETLSGKVRILSESDISRGTLFDPKYQDKEEDGKEGKNDLLDFERRIQIYINEHVDTEETAKVEQWLSTWDEWTPFEHVRKSLDISPETQKKVEIIILTKNSKEIHADTRSRAFCIHSGTGIFIILPQNWSSFIEHEYVHSQGKGLYAGYQGLLFDGINEALTESMVTIPHEYLQQRAILKEVLSVHPEYEPLLKAAYVGNSESRKIFFSKLIQDYGLDGFLTLSRSSPRDNISRNGKIGESIYLRPGEVLDFFRQHKIEDK